MVLIDERFDENEKNLELLEQKTANNFKIAEKALLAHRDFLNQIDARLTVEEMVAAQAQKSFEERVVTQFDILESEIDLQSERLQTDFKKKLDNYQKYFEEDIVPSHLVKLEEQLKNLQSNVGEEND
mmetsp:Transcript_29720/g.27206  ORF Transcript_29720/g.27206 Transcript_29720/m.27206 type:complete len:127 (-) Transcript_29720:1038-1418(-)